MLDRAFYWYNIRAISFNSYFFEFKRDYGVNPLLTIKVPIAGEGEVRSEIEKSVLNSRLNLV
jgi:hypothetical protein